MTILQIRYFIEVAKEGSFTRAAGHMYISQQAVSKQIGALEQELGFPLFRRTSGGIELTRPGAYLCEKWVRMLSEHDSHIEKAKQLHENNKKPVHIGIIEVGRVIDRVLPVLKQCEREYPDVEFHYLVGSASKLNRLFDSLAADILIAFSSDMAVEGEQANIRPLSEVQLGIALPGTHALCAKEEIELSDIEHEVIYLLGDAYVRSLDVKVKHNIRWPGKPPANIKKVDDFANIRMALLTGRGITLTFDVFFQDDAQIRFYPIPPHLLNERSFLQAAWREEEHRAYIDFICRGFS